MTSHRRFARHAFFLIAVPLMGCGDDTVAPPAAGKSTASTGADVPTQKADAEDRSLTPAEYIDAGMPAHDRLWMGADMAAASRVIAQIGNNPEQLPRYESERSGEMFARMTSAANLAFYRSKSQPLSARFPDLIAYMSSQNEIAKVYLASMLKSGEHGEELIELMGGGLRIAVVLVELTDEFVPPLDPMDPTYPTRVNGLNTLKSGMATLVAGALQTLTESHAYRPESLKRMIAYLDETLPAILPALPEGSRGEMTVRLKNYAADPKMSRLQPELTRLAARVANAAAPADE